MRTSLDGKKISKTRRFATKYKVENLYSIKVYIISIMLSEKRKGNVVDRRNENPNDSREN